MCMKEYFIIEKEKVIELYEEIKNKLPESDPQHYCGYLGAQTAIEYLFKI